MIKVRSMPFPHSAEMSDIKKKTNLEYEISVSPIFEGS